MAGEEFYYDSCGETWMPRKAEVEASLLFTEACTSLCNRLRITCTRRARSARLPDASSGLARAQVPSLSTRAVLGLCWIAAVQVRWPRGCRAWET